MTEDADLSFASLLLALRHSTDDLDKNLSLPAVKPSLNFHKDFYRNSSYDNECSNAAESLTTLSSCSTDGDSPLGSDLHRTVQSSSIGWKRRSDPCVNNNNDSYNSSFIAASMKPNSSTPKLFDYSPNSGPGSSQFRSSGFGADAYTVHRNPDMKKLCRASSSVSNESLGGRVQSKGRSASAHERSSGEFRDKEELKESHGNRKNNRETKSSKKESKEALKELKEHDKLCADSLLVICRSAEDQKEIDDKNEARLLKIARGRYKCSRCGALKTNHDCPIIEEYAGSVATQAERVTLRPEEFLSGVMKTCTLLTVRPKYCAAATHTLSLALPCTLKSTSSASALSRSSSFNTAYSRSVSYSAAGASYGNDTEDNNTTNSNSDNDSDTKSASASRNNTRALGNSTDSEASSMPSLQPTAISMTAQASMRLSALSVCADGLHGLENKIGGLGVYSLNRNENFAAALNGPKRDDPNSDHRSPGYHLTYQSHSFSGNSSENASAMSSPRDYDIPLPL